MKMDRWLSDEEKEELKRQIIECVKQVKTRSEIAKITGRSYSYICFVMRSEGIELKKKRQEALERKEKILELYSEGKSTEEIAKAVNLRPDSVDRALRRLEHQGVITYRRNRRQMCRLTPGKLCLNCPYPDCYGTSIATTKEEAQMLKDALYVPVKEELW